MEFKQDMNPSQQKIKNLAKQGSQQVQNINPRSRE